jgi:hypothetical protein
LSISLDGVAERDFTMVFGFPGKTMEYMHSAAVEQTMNANDPAKIAVRNKTLAVMDGYMRKDPRILVKYAAKYAGVSNAWKKWQGEVLGLTRTNAVGKKKNEEAVFQQRVDANPQWKNSYGNLLKELEAAWNEIRPYGLIRDYHLEIVSRIELFNLFGQLRALQRAKGRPDYPEMLARFRSWLDTFYNEYDPTVDKTMFETLMPMYPAEKYKSADYSKWANDIYNSTDADDAAKTLALARQNPDALLEKINTDNAYKLYYEISTWYNDSIAPRLNEIQARINQLQRTYMQAQMEVFKEKVFYPDANSTLRVTYGNVKGYAARDAVLYDHYSYLDGVMQKYVPGDYEFDVPQKLRDLYQKKDYGVYGRNGKMPVCFIASNHTTGGNSGSPALDAYGNLVGLNFDRVWEGTMSDISYDPSICRNIMVDVRYVLFIIDKYAGAGHLVKEMKLVHPKAGK